MRKQTVNEPKVEDYLDDIGTAAAGPRSALLWFEAPDAAPGKQYGIYRAALHTTGRGKQRDDSPEALAELKALQIPIETKASKAAGDTKERKWTLLMFGGGHFAGMVVSLAPRMAGRGKGKEKVREVVVLAQKTFHRYTSQSDFMQRYLDILAHLNITSSTQAGRISVR